MRCCGLQVGWWFAPAWLGVPCRHSGWGSVPWCPASPTMPMPPPLTSSPPTPLISLPRRCRCGRGLRACLHALRRHQDAHGPAPPALPCGRPGWRALLHQGILRDGAAAAGGWRRPARAVCGRGAPPAAGGRLLVWGRMWGWSIRGHVGTATAEYALWPVGHTLCRVTCKHGQAATSTCHQPALCSLPAALCCPAADRAQHHGLLDGCGGHPPPDGRPL